ncbi:threonine--tRNA ligase [Haloplasma contractile]|uniref:Threonine--tRNA ligase n=1 Tax=Haloplasma contractile SSD-17B TaxID=1033810 RepID=U2E8J5_9MOLU|nr:threonine--tRNA ligase [Haloplasma contractile]ERJ11488.1 Threonine--tRNA ligase protein [Haloplasma contractile SSD-17B]
MSEMIKITFPDGNIKEFEQGVTVEDIAQSISPGLRKKSAAGLINGELYDFNRPIMEDATIEILTHGSEKAFYVLNHSSAHLLAHAVQRLFPGAKLGVGPAIEEGFYYDIDSEIPITDADLPRIEKEMKKITSQALPIERSVVSKEEARKVLADDEYKQELIDAIPDGEDVSLYHQGEFVDLCEGGHIGNTKLIKHFKLLSRAGAYWRGNSDNKMLTRIYGTSHFSKQNLEDYLELLKERKERDHKKLGKELDLFMFNPLVGQGLPIWLPNGQKVRQQIERYIVDIEEEYGFDHVSTPIMGSVDLYRTSGHWNHYREDMFVPMEMDNSEELVLRPMSCPHHMMIYKHDLRSYRDLPIRLAEQVLQHRYEASGALTGLERVRAMTLTDSHIFVRPDQIKSEFSRTLELVHRVLKDFDVDIHYYRLSLRDPENKEKYFDDDEMWKSSQEMLRAALNENNIDYREEEGEAAFYGPKLDIQIKTALGHDITLATLQLDFLLPERFDLTYINEEGEKSRPVVIHRGLIGTYERFMALLIEQYKGAFPLWLAPKQVDIIPVSNDIHEDYAKEVSDLFRKHRIRHAIDFREEKMGYKIRESQVKKVPYSIVLGDNEMENRQVTFRRYGEKKSITVKLDDFIKVLKDEINNKVTHNKK